MEPLFKPIFPQVSNFFIVFIHYQKSSLPMQCNGSMARQGGGCERFQYAEAKFSKDTTIPPHRTTIISQEELQSSFQKNLRHSLFL